MSPLFGLVPLFGSEKDVMNDATVDVDLIKEPQPIVVESFSHMFRNGAWTATVKIKNTTK